MVLKFLMPAGPCNDRRWFGCATNDGRDRSDFLWESAVPCIVLCWVVQWMMERLNNYLSKINVLIPSGRKSKCQLMAEHYKCKHNDKHKCRNKGTSSHETSHISTTEICEFRVHSTPPRLIK